MFQRPISLKLISVAVGTATTLAMMLMLTWSLLNASSETLTIQIGEAAAGLADQVYDKIDRALTERVRDVAGIADSSSSTLDNDPKTTQALLDHALSSGLGFEWLGLIDPSLKLIAMSGDPLFFRETVQSPWVAKLLAKEITAQPMFRLLPPQAPGGLGAPRQPWHIELAVPVFDSGGKLRAVAAGVANWDWAQSAVRSLKQSPRIHDDVELIVVANDGRVLLAPQGHATDMAGSEVFRKTQAASAGWLVEPDAQGIEHVFGFSRAVTHHFYDGLGLTVIIRQNTAVALAPLAELKRKMFWYLLLFAIHAIAFHYILSSAIAEPLLRITRAADELRQTGKANIPQISTFSETKVLSESLTRLVDELKRREESLLTLGSSLEVQVQERTRDLEQKNALLAEATREVERAIEAKSRFLAAASHDLRQPLQALLLFSEALKRRVFEPEPAQLIGHLDQALCSLREMLDTLLHIARLDAGLVSATFEPLRLRDLIERLGTEFSFAADQRGLKFNFKCTDCYVMTDSTLLETIIRNLLSNAFKFTATGGVLLAGRSRGPDACIEIYDTGTGIVAERLKTVFYEFERSREHAGGQNDGLGLGLSIVERYSKLIGATVSVQSTAGHGSRFSVTVAKIEAPSFESKKPVLAPTASALHAINIMLVDDNSKLLAALNLDLSNRGAKISAFDKVGEAICAVEAGLPVDVAVIDYDLGGGIKGVDLIQRWRCEGRLFNAIVLTGRTDGRTLSEISSSGIPWMTKPASSDSIARAIVQISSPEQHSTQSASIS
jgi:signal transduction histidine kinase/ActR/RegA family two-component response regulator